MACWSSERGVTASEGSPTIRCVSGAQTAATPLGRAGVQRVLLGASRCDGSPLLMGVSEVRPSLTTPLIQHDSAEIAYVLDGAGSMITDDAEHPFVRGDAILIEAGCWRAIRAAQQPVEMLFVFPSRTVPPTRIHPSSPE